MSGFASRSLKPGKNSPFGSSTGAVNQASPVPESLMPNSVPLRHIADTRLQASIPRTGSITALPIAMPMLRKNCSLPAMNARLRARVSASPAARAKCGASARKVSAEQATLRWCISSPMARPREMSGASSSPPKARSALPNSGPKSLRSQASRASTCASLAPKRITLPKPSLIMQ